MFIPTINTLNGVSWASRLAASRATSNVSVASNTLLPFTSFSSDTFCVKIQSLVNASLPDLLDGFVTGSPLYNADTVLFNVNVLSYVILKLITCSAK